MQALNGVPYVRTSAPKKFFARIIAGSLFLLSTISTPTFGQSFLPGAGFLQSNNVTDDALRALMQRAPAGQNSSLQLQPSIQIQNPPVYSPEYSTRTNRQDNTAATVDAAPSVLEKLMTVRIGQSVKQFGYDLFVRGAPVIVRQSGALQDNYLLGTGDEIVVTFQGQQNAAYRARIDRDGRLVLPGMAPVSASGRSFGALRGDLEAAVSRSFAGTNVAASIGEVRQLSVRVVGEVNQPGIFSLSGLSTALDALNLAGGVKKTGSLRNIKILRGNRTIPFDVYGLITDQTGKTDVTLTEGDRILVPLHTLSAAVAGQVKRPAIYEFPTGQATLRISDLLQLAGGPQLRGSYRFSILRTRDDGKRELVQVQAGSGSEFLIRDGDALLVDSASDVSLAKVELTGSVTLSGPYALDSASTLHELLKSADIFSLKSGQPLPYLLIAGVLRIDPQSLQRTVLPFSPIDVLAGKSDLKLQSNDVVYIINGAEMQYIAKLVSAAQEPAKRRQPDDRTPLGGAPEQPGMRSPARQQDTIQATIGALQTAPALGSVTGSRGPVAVAGQTIGYPGGQPDLFPNEAYTNAVSGLYPGDFSDANGLPERAPPNNSPLPQLDGIPDPFDLGAYGTSFAPQPDGLSDSGASYDGRPGTRPVPAPPPMLRSIRRRRLFAGLDDEQRQLLVSTLGNYYVVVAGEVNHPGAFLAMPETTLDRMVQAAGGLTPKVDLKGFEITSAEIDNRSGTSRTIRKTYDIAADQFSTIALRPYDRVRFNPVFSDRDEGEVILYGEVRFPGSYEILRGERLSSVLARAGGFNDAAYAYGAIFLRRSVAEQERGVLQREADTLQSQLVALLGSVSSKTEVSPSEIQYINQMADRLRQTEGQGGRVAVQLDPQKLAGHPELDIVLEPGDRLFVPRKPNSVVVAGEVMSPSGIQYRDHLTVRSYIEQAGGVTEIADESHIFVVQPDGSAVQASDGGWLGGSTPLAPGSVIVVPRNLRPFSFSTLFENIVQTTSQLAITAASISVVAK